MPHNTAFQCKDVPGCWVVVIQKNRRRWQHLCTEMQQDEFETRVTFLLCFRARHYSCPSKSSCKVTGMTTSTGLWQISLLTAVPSWKREHQKELHGCCQMTEDVTTARHGFCRGLTAHFWFHSHPGRYGGHLSTNNVGVSLLMFELALCLGLWSETNWDSIILRMRRGCKCISQNSFQLDTRHSWQLGAGGTLVELSSLWRLLGLTIFVFHWMDSDDSWWCFFFFLIASF